MSKRLPISDEDRNRASRLIDQHFAVVSHLLDHPEVLDALPDGAVIELDATQPSTGEWLTDRSNPHRYADNVVVGKRTGQQTTLSGTHLEGPERAGQASDTPTSHAQVST